MKKLIPLIFLGIGLFISIFSCKRDDEPIPVAAYSYTYTQECNIPSEVNFQNLSLDAEIYRWNFDDGSPVVYEKNPKHLFQHEGIYNVELTAYGNGGMHEQIKAIYIVSSPVISFSASDTIINVNGNVLFTGNALSGVLPSAWFWNFGDGTTSNLQNPSHTYLTPGLFDVTLTAVNACGSAYIEKKKHITVNSLGSAPNPDFIANTTNITVGQFVNFTDLTINNPTNWNWTFNGATTVNSTIQNPINIQYNIPGNYNVTLTSSNAQGSNSITKTQYIHVLNTAPTTVFIKKITVKQMNFPPTPPIFVNLFYKLTNSPPSILYLNGLPQIITGLFQSSLPVSWILSPNFQLPVLNQNYQISLWDRKGFAPNYIENPVGFVQFNPANYTTYPTVINLIQNNINIEIELQWQ
ncbi:MAG: PKD domain-containing protein [Bacteroidia bacterium]|nr:PKD domain-containing protein [Bacteroidia bacterium]